MGFPVVFSLKPSHLTPDIPNHSQDETECITIGASSLALGTAERETSFSNGGTLWLSNIAMENGPFIDGLPMFTY